MNGIENYLIDTNILIHFFDGKMTDRQKSDTIRVFEKSFNISVISKIEFLGFKKYLDTQKYKRAKEFINKAKVIALSDRMIETIIKIKQKRNTKLGDAIIAATAITKKLILVTRNEKDFDKINGLLILNPFKEY